MRGSVVVEEETAFQAWLSSHPTFAQTSAQAAGNVAVGASRSMPCAVPVMACKQRVIRAACAETEWTRGLVPETAIEILQARRAGHTRQGCVR